MSLSQFDAQGSLSDSLGSIVPALFDDQNNQNLRTVTLEGVSFSAILDLLTLCVR
jgi:hypothetical protein